MDLLPDLLREISGRLHDAADYVRFHAVCRPWRDSHSPDVPTIFPPWLLAPSKQDKQESIKIRCVFSKTSYRAPPPPTEWRRCWVAAADGTAVGYLTVTAGPCSGLHYPLTGNRTLPLPPCPFSRRSERTEDPDGGIVYGDGTILLFSGSSHNRFIAALLRPGDTAWTLLERSLPSESEYGVSSCCCVVYHGGRIMVTVGASEWLVMATDGVAEDDDVMLPMTWLPREDDDHIYHRSYALQTRGELLWVSVQIPRACGRLLRVSVLALREAPGKLSWARKDGRSLADRVLFLGWPNSFAMDAAGQLGGDGGCAYFVYNDDGGLPADWLGVFRYNLMDEKLELVEWLPQPQGWNVGDSCTWLVPQPVIAPMQGTSEIRLKAPKRKQHGAGPRRMIQMLRPLFQCVGAQPSSTAATTFLHQARQRRSR